MKHNYVPYLLFRLRELLEHFGFIPAQFKPLIVDGESHECKCCKTDRNFFYEAHIDDFGGGLPVLIAHCGSDNKKRHKIKVSVPELLKK